MNNKSKFQEILQIIKNNFDSQDLFIDINENGIQPFVEIKSKNLLKICSFLNEYPKLFFDTLTSITALDNGIAESPRFELKYHFNSIINELFFTILIKLEEDNLEAPTLSKIWKTAEWHERECYDLMGIKFVGNEDLRRILLPTDWVGHPLRKDYEEQEKYHGIKIKSV